MIVISFSCSAKIPVQSDQSKDGLRPQVDLLIGFLFQSLKGAQRSISGPFKTILFYFTKERTSDLLPLL